MFRYQDWQYIRVKHSRPEQDGSAPRVIATVTVEEAEQYAELYRHMAPERQRQFWGLKGDAVAKRVFLLRYGAWKREGSNER